MTNGGLGVKSVSSVPLHLTIKIQRESYYFRLVLPKESAPGYEYYEIVSKAITASFLEFWAIV